jgi:leucyl aminopeptidase
VASAGIRIWSRHHEIVVTQGNIAAQSADCIVVNLFEGVTAPGGATGAVDAALDGMISRADRRR